jgi:hypothetical protein
MRCAPDLKHVVPYVPRWDSSSAVPSASLDSAIGVRRSEVDDEDSDQASQWRCRGASRAKDVFR